MNSEARIYAKWAMTYAAALALVGCGGSANDNIEQPMPAAASASVQLPDPCKLFSDQELIAEFGGKPDGWSDRSIVSVILFVPLARPHCRVVAARWSPYSRVREK